MTHAGNPALWEAKSEGLLASRSWRSAWATRWDLASTKSQKISLAWWFLLFQLLRRPMWEDHLNLEGGGCSEKKAEWDPVSKTIVTIYVKSSQASWGRINHPFSQPFIFTSVILNCFLLDHEFLKNRVSSMYPSLPNTLSLSHTHTHTHTPAIYPHYIIASWIIEWQNTRYVQLARLRGFQAH